jgi:hypothetical protein
MYFNGGSGRTMNTSTSYTLLPVRTVPEITSFSLNGQLATIIDHTVHVVLPYGVQANLRSAVPEFTATKGATVKIGNTVQQSRSSAIDFTKPVEYTVTAPDGTSATYTVIVYLQTEYSKAITDFFINGNPGVIVGNDISVTLPKGTNLKGLRASFNSTGSQVKVGAELQISGETLNDFDDVVMYTVFDSEGGSATYRVHASLISDTSKSFLTFSLDDGQAPGVIVGNNILIDLPYTSESIQTPTYLATTDEIYVGNDPQNSRSEHNFVAGTITYTLKDTLGVAKIMRLGLPKLI